MGPSLGNNCLLLSFYSISVRLAEWIEANLLFGADKIVIYTYAVHPNVAKILEYYSEKNAVHAIPLTLPGNMPNIPQYRSSFIQRNRQQKRRNELIPYNDCLYRHLHTHRFVLIVDIDEVVVPMQHKNWAEMLKEFDSDDSANTAYCRISKIIKFLSLFFLLASFSFGSLVKV